MALGKEMKRHSPTGGMSWILGKQSTTVTAMSVHDPTYTKASGCAPSEATFYLGHALICS